LKNAISVLFLISCLLITNGNAESWTGADEKAEEAIKQISPDYEPWFSPVWEPPSGEIESLLFSLQSAIGAFAVGYFVGKSRANKHASNN